MNSLKIFDIAYKGLALGQHIFHYSVEKDFFSSFENTDILDAKVDIDLVLNRKETLMQLAFNCKGSLQVECDRCLDPLALPVEFSEHLIVKLEENQGPEDEGIVFLPEGETKINVAEYIYEFIVLSLPLRRVHANTEEGVSTCNAEIIDKLDHMTVSSHQDPRWEELKKIINN